MVTVAFDEIERLQNAGDWDTLGGLMAAAARQLERGGADGIVLCTNTMHLVADAIQEATSLPFLHVGDAVGERARAEGFRTVGLLGTAFTMERPFYRERLTEQFGLEVIVPETADRRLVHDVIFGELIAGVQRPESRAAYRDVVARLVERGAEAVILGCTEIMMLIDATDSSVPLLDTTTLHALAAVDFALAGDGATERASG